MKREVLKRDTDHATGGHCMAGAVVRAGRVGVLRRKNRGLGRSKTDQNVCVSFRTGGQNLHVRWVGVGTRSQESPFLLIAKVRFEKAGARIRVKKNIN